MPRACSAAAIAPCFAPASPKPSPACYPPSCRSGYSRDSNTPSTGTATGGTLPPPDGPTHGRFQRLDFPISPTGEAPDALVVPAVGRGRLRGGAELFVDGAGRALPAGGA